MKNSTLLLTAGIILLLVYGCKKEDRPYVRVKRCPDLTRDIDKINQYIIGKWEWIEEEYYDRRSNSFVYYTPNSLGRNKKTLYFFDNKVQITGYGAYDGTYKFRIHRLLEFTNYPTDSLPVLVYYYMNTGQRMSPIPIMLCRDQMLFQSQIWSDVAGEKVWRRSKFRL
jgi:hypothetical protein